jgi:hypothetical protein
MPTTAEFQALSAAVNTVWTDDYQGSGVAGLVCTDKIDSSKALFFPAAGGCFDGSVEGGSGGGYWSSSLYTDHRLRAYILIISKSNTYWDVNDFRNFGYAVRPVMDN